MNMNNRNRSHFHPITHTAMRFYVNPSGFHQETQWELEREYASKKDPDKPPLPESGDKYISVCAIIGIIFGAVVGIGLGFWLGLAYITIFFAAIIGVVIGGLAGASIGARIKKNKLTPKS
jgi:hypothetical protein